MSSPLHGIRRPTVAVCCIVWGIVLLLPSSSLTAWQDEYRPRVRSNVPRRPVRIYCLWCIQKHFKTPFLFFFPVTQPSNCLSYFDLFELTLEEKFNLLATTRRIGSRRPLPIVPSIGPRSRIPGGRMSDWKGPLLSLGCFPDDGIRSSPEGGLPAPCLDLPLLFLRRMQPRLSVFFSSSPYL
ncbi:hypothetical protein NPIL_660141 [Nephila pilipes]|uniref:Uncharacterized protein n=1 Tax=Nephila pilipes TaxID=299642 RepID=A0A8X6J8Z0_NEPPI|nr:hypothetical protein NPIL_660141 [Nephila pilipes]